MSFPIITSWTHLKELVDGKNLPIQYEYNLDGYVVFAVDGIVIYQTTIYNDAVPDPSIYSQSQNDADKADFLSFYYPFSNLPINGNAARDGYAVDGNATLIAGQDDNNLARIIRTDSSGREVVVGAGTAGTPVGGILTVQGNSSGTPIPISGTITANNASVGSNNAAAPASSTQIGGTDGTNLQSVRVYDTDSGGGTQYTLGVNLRKSASGGSVELGTSTDPIRIDPTGTTAQPVTDNGGSLTVDGTVTVTQATASNLNAQVQGTAADGATPVGNPVLIAGQDGTNVQSLLTDTSGRANVVGAAASGAAVAGNPVRVGFSDGTTTRDGLSDTSGRQIVVGAAADGAAVTGNPVLIGGSDGTNAQTISTDTNGGIIVTGRDAHNSPPTANPVLVAGWDGTNVVRLRINSDGTIATSDRELATFVVIGTNILPANNKSMISILNADATLITKIHEIYVVNVRTAAVTGVTGVFELRRITSHSGGTVLTSVSMDTNDTLDSDITVRTGSTVGGESASLMWRVLFSTDDWGPGTLDVESNDHIFQTMFSIFSRKTDSGTKPLTLRQNQGLTVKFATNSTAGEFDLMLVFTQE